MPPSSDRLSADANPPVGRGTYRVRVSKDYLGFCSAHFIVYNHTQCERLHGHNYRVAAELEATLDEDHLVLDFIALKKILMVIMDELDHRLLVPLESDKFDIAVDAKRVKIAYEDREWIVPREDCVLLPIANSTTELLARHVSDRLSEELERVGAGAWKRLEIEVQESPGQSAIFRREPEPR